MRIALVDLPPLLGETLLRVLAASPGVSVQRVTTSAGGYPSSIELGEFDAVLGRWPAEQEPAVVRDIQQVNRRLVVISAAPGPPEQFRVFSRDGSVTLPSSTSPRELIAEIRRGLEAE